MKNYGEINLALTKYFIAYNDLQKLGITSNKKDFTSQIGEWFVRELYGGESAINSIQKDWDLKLNDKYIQVKTHSKAVTNKNRHTKLKYNDNAKIDELITVVFTFDYKLKEFYKIPWENAQSKIRHNKGGSLIRWDDQEDFKIHIDDLPNQSLVSLFRP